MRDNRSALLRCGVLFLLFWGVVACGNSEEQDAISIQLYSPSGLGLPNTFPPVAEMRVVVYDRDKEAVVTSNRFPADLSGGRELLNGLSEADALMLLFEARDVNDAVVASGGSAFFGVKQGQSVLQFAIYMVPTDGFSAAQALFGTELGVGVTVSPYEDGRGRAGHRAVKLEDGRVLIIGGANLTANGTGLSSSNVSALSEGLILYNPNTGYFDLVKDSLGTVKLSAPRAFHTATPLPDGRILITGGLSVTGNTLTALRSTELIEKRDDGSFVITPLPPMAVPRYGHTATLRADGTVLIAGGRTLESGNSRVHSSAELFVPSLGSFVPTQSMNAARAEHTATLIDNTNVLIMGGTDGTNVHASTELFTINTNNEPVFVTTPSMSSPRRGQAAIMLEQGGGQRFVLTAGGYSDLESKSALASLEILDTDAGQFINPQNLLNSRAQFNLVRLSDERILAVGGVTSDGTRAATTADAEILTPIVPDGIDFSIKLVGSPMSQPRFDPEVVTLDNGQIFITGGGRLDNGVTTSHLSSDIYNPGLPAFAQ